MNKQCTNVKKRLATFLNFKRFFVVSLFFLFTGGLFATDLKGSGIDNEKKFNAKSRIWAISSTNMTVEIRRSEKNENYRENAKASIGIWCPFLEPPPVDRTLSNMLTTKGKVFRNTGAGKDQFPYVIKEETTGKFFVFRNLKYTWLFENQLADKADPDNGNATHTTVIPVYTPFFDEIALTDKAPDFMKDWATQEGNDYTLPEPKVHANRHTVVYDSGVANGLSVSDSSILQQVGMIMSYEVAEVSPAVSGDGYPETGEKTANLSGDKIEKFVKGTANLSVVPGSFQTATFTTPIPDEYAPFWKLGLCSAYQMVYVEDYKPPVAKVPAANSPGQPFGGSVGKWLEQDITIDWTDDNASASKQSQQLKATFQYHCGMDDLYKIKNPYATADNGMDPYFYFIILRGNDEFGPYIGPQNLGREIEIYNTKHPYWSKRPKDEVTKYLTDRRAYATEVDSIPPWMRGVIYFVMGDVGGGAVDPGLNATDRMKKLNNAWRIGEITQASCPIFFEIREDLKTLTTDAAKEAVKDLDALEDATKNPSAYSCDTGRGFNRFAQVTLDVGDSTASSTASGTASSTMAGSYLVGPIELEKDNPEVYFEEQKPNDSGTTVKSGWWKIKGKRVLLPMMYATGAKDDCDVSCFTTREVMQVSQSNCCGNSVTVKPAENQSEVFLKDDVKPCPECSLTDSRNGTEHSITIPAGDDLAYNEKLVVSNKDGSNAQSYSANQYGGDFDCSKCNFAVQKGSDAGTQVGVIPDDPNGALKDKVIYENVRMQIKLGGYDNVNKATPFRGIGKQTFSIFALNPDGSRGNPETLEWPDDSGNVQSGQQIVRDNNGDPYKWTPNLKLYHIFRTAGMYQAVYTLDSAVSGNSADHKTRTLTFNIHVLPLIQGVQTIEQKQERGKDQ
ncbi:MAG: hypothetical protein HQM08_10600 [Candidatus Riflebacteria bacterium]|nr:hypothetical protein [Candidatus Riflebacteria bacterium]